LTSESEDDDELLDNVPELDAAGTRAAILKKMEWREPVPIDPAVDPKGAARQKRSKEKFMAKRQRILRQLPKVPLRPFQAPPQVIDMTGDAQYELKWIPIHAVHEKKKKMGREELVAGGHVHDEKALGGDLFDQFYDQGDMLRDFTTPQECAEAAAFWKEEANQSAKAGEIVKKFQKVRPHDYFKIEPQSYNLSI